MTAVARTSAPVCLAAEAMRCRFEFVLHGDDPSALRAAGEEALREIRALERRVNVFSSASELSRINRTGAREAVAISPALFDLLCMAKDLSERTDGAFDPTVGPLVRLWRRAWESGRLPRANEFDDACRRVGMEGIELDATRRTIRFHRQGMALNLNALAKGRALDLAADALRETGVRSALLHGGTSSVVTMGAPPDTESWTVAIADPLDPERVLDTVELTDEALGVSSQTLQQRNIDGVKIGHVIHPSTGRPTEGALLAAATAPTAARADALSTALLCDPEGAPNWLHPDETALMVRPETPHEWARMKQGLPLMTQSFERTEGL